MSQAITRIMIDMETVDTCENAGILTLGACTFGLPFSVPRKHFYERASLSSNEFLKRSISKETMEWWDKQDPEMRKETFGGTDSIVLVLDMFVNWASRIAPIDEIELWSRGAGFDCNILQHAYQNLQGHYPFDFRKHMCQRTIERLMPPDLRNLLPKHTNKHHALQDALFQADVMDVALNNISFGPRM